MASNTNPTLTKFDVSNVRPSSYQYKGFRTDPEALRRLSKGADSTSDAGQPPKRMESFSRIPRPLIKLPYEPGIHPFVETIHTAFDRHYPVRLSPDHIWILIAQAVSLHLKQNPDDGPAHLKAGKKEPIVVIRDEFILGNLDNDWDGAIREFGEKIREKAGEEFHDQFVQSFSTTTSIESTAMKVTLMEAGSLYFEYVLLTRCGITSVELEGTVEDWEKLVSLADSVAQYGMGWWVPHLKGVAKQFLDAAKGNPDRRFWQDFYKLREASGGPRLTGHFLKLFPYLLKKGTPVVNEHMDESANGTGCKSDVFPNGSSVAPMVWEYLGECYRMEIISGFSGVSQDESLALRPEIGWVVVHASNVVEGGSTPGLDEEAFIEISPWRSNRCTYEA